MIAIPESFNKSDYGIIGSVVGGNINTSEWTYDVKISYQGNIIYVISFNNVDTYEGIVLNQIPVWKANPNPFVKFIESFKNSAREYAKKQGVPIIPENFNESDYEITGSVVGGNINTSDWTYDVKISYEGKSIYVISFNSSQYDGIVLKAYEANPFKKFLDSFKSMAKEYVKKQGILK